MASHSGFDHGDPGTRSAPEISLAVGDPASDDGSLVGERFGNYLLVAELAAGGMAEVFLAVHEGPEGFHKVVVVKRVLPQLGRSPELARMFLAEARVCARLEHPNIVRTTELGEARGQYFTVMEYLAGEDLRGVLARAAQHQVRIAVELVAAIMAQVCAGLHCAHELTDTEGRGLGLVHRDVTPANIIVTFGGEVKLIDFGVAKLAQRGPETLAGTLKGKLAYMSPEQLRGRAVDRRSDVFAAGIVLWELLAGAPLFARETDAATLFAVASDPIPPLRTEVPEALVAIAERALARDPAQRFATAEDMQLALDGFLASGAARRGAGSAPRESPARGLSRMLYQLFGERYGDAKRAIAQSRSLAHNVALIRQLRDGSGDRARSADRAPASATPTRSTRGRGYRAVMLAVIVCVTAGWAYLARQQLAAGMRAGDRDSFARGHALFDGVRARIQGELRAQCRVLVEDPRLKATLGTDGIDEVTVRDILADLDKLRRTGFLLVLSRDGRVFAESGAGELRGLDLWASSVVKAARGASEAIGGSWVIGGRVVDLGIAPVGFGTTGLAYVVVGQPIDAALLRLVGEGTGLAIAVIAGSEPGPVSSDEPALRAVFEAMARDGGEGIVVQGGARYATHAVELAEVAQARPRLAMARALAPPGAWFEVLGWLLWAPIGLVLLGGVLVALRPGSGVG